MGIDWEGLLGTEAPESLEDRYVANIPDYYDFPDYDDDPEPEYNKNDYARGVFKGSRVSFKKMFAGHEFTGDELRDLLRGKTIPLSYTSRNGDPATTTGHLQRLTSPKGRKYYRFTPEFDPGYLP